VTQRPRRIGILTPGFSASESDWCIPALLSLVRALAREDDVRLYTLRYPHARERYWVEGVRVLPFGAGQRRGLRRLPLYRRVLSAVAAEAEAEPFDVLHAFWAHEPGYLATRVGRRLGVPTVVSILGGELVDMPEIAYGGQRSIPDRWLTNAALQAADRVTVGSSFLQAEVAVDWPRLACRVLPLGVDTTRFSPGPVAESAPRLPGRLRILHVGSLVPVKDHATLLRAFARVSQRQPEAQLSIVGDGPLRGRLEALVVELGISGLVSFLGTVPHGDLPDLYRQADLLVLSSRFESQAMVVLEAAACGVPSVGAAVGSLPELQDGSRAVPPGNPEALAMALQELLADSDARRSMGARALAKVHERFSLDVAVSRLRALYDELAEPARALVRPHTRTGAGAAVASKQEA
jgi:glycosyltransferase involved in cell wall biosynthesis